MENEFDKRVQVRCLICGSESDSLVMLFRGFRIGRCSNCDFIFVNPRPTEESLSKLYSSHDQNPYFSEGYEPLEYEKPVLEKIIRHIQKHVPAGKLLEVGCGRGDFLRIAQSYGFSVTGCDLFGVKLPILEGATFYDSTLRQARFPSDSFDVVVVRNIFEHLFDPNEEIREIRRILKPKGYLYIKVPNVEFEHGLRCRLLFRKEHAFEAPYHLNHFSPASFKKFLKNAQFELLSWYPEQPTLTSKWTDNLFRQTGYRVVQTLYFLTGGEIFPKVVLSCLAQKPA